MYAAKPLVDYNNYISVLSQNKKKNMMKIIVRKPVIRSFYLLLQK